MSEKPDNNTYWPSQTYIAIGVMIFLICLGMGSCGYLIGTDSKPLISIQLAK